MSSHTQELRKRREILLARINVGRRMVDGCSIVIVDRVHVDYDADPAQKALEMHAAMTLQMLGA